MPTFPEGVLIEIVGVEITPASDTPMIVPLTWIVPPTRSEDLIVPSIVATSMFALIVSVDCVSCPPVTVNRPKSCAWNRPLRVSPDNVQVQCSLPLSSIYEPVAVIVGAAPADVLIVMPPSATDLPRIVWTEPRTIVPSVAFDVAM